MQALAVTDGTELGVRPLERADREALAAGFARLSPESRYRRFASPIPRLQGRNLDRLVDIDHHEREAFVAYDRVSGEGVAVVRWISVPGRPGTAEIALTVADAWQGRGLGSRLAALLLERARAEGLCRLLATALSENRRAIAIVRRLGFAFAGRSGALVEYELALGC